MEVTDKHVSILSGILSIISSLMTILGGISNNAFIFILGAILTFVFLCVYSKIKSFPKYTEIEGIRIEEADNIPLFVPKKNQLNPLQVTHVCEIDGSSAKLEYEYFGVCVDKNGMEFFSTNLYSHDISDLSDMNWYAYDLRNDSQKNHKIKPQLKSPKGATKRVLFRFRKRIEYNEVCSYYTYQEVKNSVKIEGKDYYVSIILYKNRPLHDYKVILKFHDTKPISINVYTVKNKKEEFLYDLTSMGMVIENNTYIYTDNVQEETAWSIRVYLFDRHEACDFKLLAKEP